MSRPAGTWRTGITTGTCAAAAAAAAATLLAGELAPAQIQVLLPGGEERGVDILNAKMRPDGSATAAVRKYAGDDPDVTDGATIEVTLRPDHENGITFCAGPGVGMVTRAGLQVPPGEPAINPTPRKMIAAAIGDVYSGGVVVTVSIPHGEEIAQKTFNPRLGIKGGLSILGTTGIVRPYCRKAMLDAIDCGLDVARAAGDEVTLVPGNIGLSLARRYFPCRPEQAVEVGNAWGAAIDAAAKRGFARIHIAGHPGKLAKLIDGGWETHSADSETATIPVTRVGQSVLHERFVPCDTTEGMFAALNSKDSAQLAAALGEQIAQAVSNRLEDSAAIEVLLGNMAGEELGRFPASKKNITIIGCGPGGKSYLPADARATAKHQDVLVGPARLLELFDDTDVPQHPLRWAEYNDYLETACRQGTHVGVLVSGDPAVFSAATKLAERFAASIAQVIPAPSSAEVALEKLGLPHTPARHISAHGREPEVSFRELANEQTLVIFGGDRQANVWAGKLGEALGDGWTLYVCENVTLKNESIQRVTATKLQKRQTGSLTLIVLTQENPKPMESNS